MKLNKDYKYIYKACPAYIAKLEHFDRELFSKFDCKLDFEFDDHSNTSLRFWVQKEGKRVNDNDVNPEIKLVLDNLKITLKETCSQCGSNHNVSFRNELYQWNSHYVDQMYLCVECFTNYQKEELRLSISTYTYFSNQKCLFSEKNDVDKSFVKKKIRFINNLCQFDYAEFGAYFFYCNELFVISDEIIYKDFDIKNKFIKTIYSNTNNFIIKGLYAGHDTGFLDDGGEIIYTGDIIRMKGTLSFDERDPHKYFEKYRNVPKKNQNIFDVYGAVSSNEICREAYQVVLEDYGAFLCHGIEMEVLGNVFFELNPNERIDIWKKASEIAQSGFDSNGFWNIYSRENIKVNLNKIQTPSFKKITSLNKIINTLILLRNFLLISKNNSYKTCRDESVL